MFGLRRWYKLPEVQPHGGGDMIAQHAAERGPRSAPLLRASGWEVGMLGKVEKRFESPGDDRGSHTDSLAPDWQYRKTEASSRDLFCEPANSILESSRADACHNKSWP